MQQKDAFPTRLFLVYIFFYSGQAIYNTYLNLYLASVGLTTSQIGLIVSVSTAFILVAQMLWGMASDRAKTKNSILVILYLCSAAVGFLFYLGSQFWFLLALVTLFSVFFNPIMPLQDNIMLETLETSRWDYGQVRMGGTLGYCVTVLIIGFVLQDNYRNIFWMVSLAMLICCGVFLGTPKVRGWKGEAHRTPVSALLKNTTLLGIIAFNLVFSTGLNFYYSFYPIYFTAIGGNSSLIGVMMFACAVAEIPVLLIINRLVRRLGIAGVLILAALATALRWFLLYALRNPYAIIAANLLHGIGFTSFSYCIITYINNTVPKDLRATSQTMNVVVSSVVSRIVFGYLGGLATERVGAGNIMLLSSLLMLAATGIFALWARTKKEILRPTGVQEPT